MKYVPEKAQYLLQTVTRNPSELLRLANVAWASFRYRWISRCVGSNTIVGERTVMTNNSNIEIGSGCLIKDRVYLRAGINGRILIEDGAALNSFVQLYGHGGITIGKDTQVGPNTVITTTGHDYVSTELDTAYSPITIGERVWIGANCTILGGVNIGNHAVIGAGAVVTKDIPSHCVAVGVPARVVRTFADTENDDVSAEIEKNSNNS
jgi:acetyltransferase-like isoleucine patch superfamily enzyme